jgi:hypothetical protein
MLSRRVRAGWFHARFGVILPSIFATFCIIIALTIVSAALSIKLVTVLVPSAALATVPIASDAIACFARGNLLSIPGIPDHRWYSILVFNCRRLGAWIYQLRSCERIQRSPSRDQLAYLPARDCPRGVFGLCAKPDGLAQIQASSGSGPSEREGDVAVLTAPRRNAGIRQPSGPQK